MSACIIYIWITTFIQRLKGKQITTAQSDFLIFRPVFIFSVLNLDQKKVMDDFVRLLYKVEAWRYIVANVYKTNM